MHKGITIFQQSILRERLFDVVLEIVLKFRIKNEEHIFIRQTLVNSITNCYIDASK